MASRTFYGVQALTRELKPMPLSFDTNGSSSPVTPKGKGFTVARTGTGQYTITLQDQYDDLISVSAPSMVNFAVQVGTWTKGSGSTKPTLVVWTLVSGAPANVAAGADNRVNLTLWLTNSNIR
jgi:hypothetical protein